MRRYWKIALLIGCTSFLFALSQERCAGGEFDDSLRRLKEYEAAEDKLAFVLAHADSPDDNILLWVAMELGNYPDPKSVEVLQRLSRHMRRPPNYMPQSVSRAAEISLEKISAAPLLKKLHGQEPIEERLKIARELAGGTNQYARQEASKFCRENIAAQPAEIVPILVEFYAGWLGARKLALQHAEHIGNSLERGLRSPTPTVVIGSIELVGDLDRQEYLPLLALYLCSDRDDSANPSLIGPAREVLVKFGDRAVPHLSQVLNSGCVLAQFDAIADLGRIASPSAKAELSAFIARYSAPTAGGWRRKDELIERAKKHLSQASAIE